MRSFLRVLLIVGLTCSPAAAQTGQSRADAIDAAMNTIRADAIRAEMRFLSSKELAGRAPGTEGYQIAAQYVATQMEAVGLKPAGVNGTWFQPVPLRRSQAVADQTTLEVTQNGKTEPLVFAEDFVSRLGAQADVTVDAPVVFVGFGVTAPEMKYDDYTTVDVRGKIVVWLWGAPASFPSTERAYYTDLLTKERNAVARGAVGCLTILSPDDQQRLPWKWLVPQLLSGSMTWLEAGGRAHDTFPELRGVALMSQEGAEKLFKDAGTALTQVFADAKAGTPHAGDLPATARMRTVTRLTDLQSPNVIGVLRGSDPGLRNEYVVYTAHLDHLGICPPVDGDDVCHGAADNASGAAVVLEIARALASLPKAPRRSVLFVFVTGEEKGMVGSDFFANNPTVPRSAMVANVNVDGGVSLYAAKDVIALGAEHSTLNRNVEKAAKRLGYEVSPDPMPEEVFFIRSDQYSFVKQGVPAVMMGDGLKAVDPKVNGEAISKRWSTTVYHTPRDNMNQPFDWDATTKGARFQLLVGYDIAEQQQRPAWNAGDFFGTMFAQKSSNESR